MHAISDSQRRAVDRVVGVMFPDVPKLASGSTNPRRQTRKEHAENAARIFSSTPVLAVLSFPQVAERPAPALCSPGDLVCRRFFGGSYTATNVAVHSCSLCLLRRKEVPYLNTFVVKRASF